MEILVPIDGSDCSLRAIEFAIEFASRYDGSIQVVHFTDVEGESTDEVLDRATELLEQNGIEKPPELLTDRRLSDPRYASQVGKDILKLVDAEGYDHVVMGHHGNGAVGRLILGSAAETVVRASEVPATIVP